MELNNNDDEDNINRNLINNNQNNNNNIAIGNNNVNNDEEGYIFISKYSHFTPSFLLLMILNILFFIYSKYQAVEEYKYVFEFVPIFEKNQYYRIITRYFIHFGIGHLLAELFISYYLLDIFENIFGTIFTLFYIINSMLLISFLQVVFSLLLNFAIYHLYIINSPFSDYEAGLAPLLFSLNTFINLFNHNYFNEEEFPIYSQERASYSSFVALLMVSFLTPNRTFIGNLTGIIVAYFMKSFCICFLPRISWIVDLEKIFKLGKEEGILYRKVTYKNIFMKAVLNQIEKNSVKEIKKETNLEKKEINNSINAEGRGENIEMSLIQNNNI